jgi:large subunit ribosomal protein L22
MISASLKNYRISPRKVRVVADMIRGKEAVLARQILVNASKKARHPLADLLDSAIANALNNFKLEKENLYVKEIRVDQGVVMKRHMPVSRGSAHPFKRRTSHVVITLGPIEAKTAKKAKGAKLPTGKN